MANTIIKKNKPNRIKPMLARDNPFDNPFDQPNYIIQEKLDGTRIIAVNQGNGWHLMTRHWKNDVSAKFPEIIKELSYIKSKDVVLDGELTFFKNGKNIFMTVLANPETKAGMVAKLMLFDIIRYNKDLTKLPLKDRIKILTDIAPKGKHVMVIETIITPSSFKQTYKKILKNKGEGIIMKPENSKYVFDSRKHWIKVKGVYTEDCIVIGITQGLGKRKDTFGALILAQYDKHNQLKIVGRTSGFDDATLLKLYSIISKMPNHHYPQFHISDAKKWVPPRLVVEVKYFEKTQYGILRHPVFLRIRDDKLPSDCKIIVISGGKK
jgi:bifunctional non-homologous end joining protein LigD